jgi:hypothetical protein
MGARRAEIEKARTEEQSSNWVDRTGVTCERLNVGIKLTRFNPRSGNRVSQPMNPAFDFPLGRTKNPARE